MAADLLERAAELDGIAPRRVEFLLEAADAAMAAGDADRAADGLRAALGVVPPGAQRARTLLALGDIVYVQRPHEALALLVDALDHTDGDPVLEALVHAHIAGMADMDPSRGTEVHWPRSSCSPATRSGRSRIRSPARCSIGHSTGCFPANAWPWRTSTADWP